MTELLPQGRNTPHFHFCNIIDDLSGSVVGETWYNVQSKGGKLQFWIDWIWIEPQFRSRGFATQVFQHLEAEAVERGADRVGLHVLAENDVAIALYSSLGFEFTNHRMSKVLRPPPKSRAQPRTGTVEGGSR